MGAAPLTLGLAAGGLSALSSFMGAEKSRNDQRARAAALQEQAAQMRRQAKLQEQQGRIEAENIDRQKMKLRRDFENLQGRNRSLLGAGNVDMTSGSALDIQLGNIDRFAEDYGENAYQKALKEWETREQVKMSNYQADVYDAQGSYLKNTAGSIGTSLLTGLIGGTVAGLSAYQGAGGTFTGAKSARTLWDDPTSQGLLMRHPAGNAKPWAYVPFRK